MGRKILVTGGNGFIGSEVCRIAVEKGHEVISVSRSGRPETDAPWAERVAWVSANVLDPGAWRAHLQGCTAVIHCVGIVQEQPSQGITFERINGDAAEVAAWEAEHAGVEHFVFFSVADKLPLLSPRFLEAKRRAEATLRGRSLRTSFLRPMYVYGTGRPSSVLLCGALNAARRLPGLRDRLRPERPLRVEQVATAAVRAATEPGYEGGISIDHIEYLAEEHWQQHREGKAVLPARPLVIGGALTGVVAGLAWATLRRP